MKAIILAAGEGSRMEPLTDDIPKPLLPVAGKPIIEYSIEKLEEEVDEIIIVGGYRIEKLQERFENRDKIRIIEQDEPLGTAHAALQARELVDDRAIILNGDDIYGDSIREMANKENAILAARVDNPGNYGVLETDGESLDGLKEKPENPDSNLINAGCYSVTREFFEVLERVDRSERGEYEITDALELYSEAYQIEICEAETYLPCSYPWQLINANEELMEEVVTETRLDGEVSEKVEIRGKVIVEEGAQVKEYSTVEGPAIVKSGSIVGPRGHIRRNTVLEEGCYVGNSEIKNSVLGEGTKVPHFSYIGDSYIGKDVNIGAGTKIANLRHDSSSVSMKVKDDLIDTGRLKLGAVIGSEAKLGVNNSVKPGRKIGRSAKTDSGEVVEKSIPSNRMLKDGEIL